MKYLKVIAVIFILGFSTSSCVSYSVPFSSNEDGINNQPKVEQAQVKTEAEVNS